jgi:hypothetical protein
VKLRVGAQTFALLWLCAAHAEAHQDSVTHLQITAHGRVITAEIRIAAIDLNEAMHAPPAQDITRDQALAGSARTATYISERLKIRDTAGNCLPGEHTASIVETNNTWDVSLRVEYLCPHAVDSVQIRYNLFFDVDPRHQGMTTVSIHGRDTQHVFRTASRDLRAGTQSSLLHQLATYVTLGIDHIFLGYDHIAFLMGLLLAIGHKNLRESLRSVLAIVTAFTVAHSLTLVSAAMGLVTLPSSLVEPAIAASIAYVALENLLSTTPRHRTALTFGFGLIHGFGFAGVLAEQGLPARALVPSLLAFNVGVEAGQLTLVVCALPVFAFLASEPRTVRKGIGAMASLGAVWAVLVHAGVLVSTLAAVLPGAFLLLWLAAHRWGYVRGVRRVASVVLSILAALWFYERVAGHMVFSGVLG